MQPVIEFEKRLTDMMRLHRTVKTEIRADTKTIQQYLHIAFISRAELDRRRSAVEALVNDYNKQQALTSCAKAHPKRLGVFKDADRKECESAAEGEFLIKAKHGIIKTETSATPQEFHDGSLSEGASRGELVKKIKTLKADDHAMVGTALKVWQNMLEGKTIEAKRLAMHRDPVSVLVALLDPIKFEETISHMSRVQMMGILKAMNNLMSGQNGSYIFSSRTILIRDIKNVIKNCRDMMGPMSKQEVKQALKVLSPAPNMKKLLESLVRDDSKALLPWKVSSGQVGGNRLTDIFKEVALLCLSVLCIVPIVPLLVIWIPYLMQDEEKKFQEIDPFANYIKDTFGDLAKNNVKHEGFVHKLLKGAQNWIMFQYQLLATFSAERMLKRTAAVTTKNMQTYLNDQLPTVLNTFDQSMTMKYLPALGSQFEQSMKNLKPTINEISTHFYKEAQTAGENIGVNLGTRAMNTIFSGDVATGIVDPKTVLRNNVKTILHNGREYIDGIVKEAKKDVREVIGDLDKTVKNAEKSGKNLIVDTEKMSKRVVKNVEKTSNYLGARNIPHVLLTKEQKASHMKTLGTRSSDRQSRRGWGDWLLGR